MESNPIRRREDDWRPCAGKAANEKPLSLFTPQKKRTATIFETLPLLIGMFALAALVICAAGTTLARVADELATKTGLGGAFFGAVFLGATTSLPGLTVSVLAAWNGKPELAMSNAIGGIAIQTTFLVIADMVFRKINLEYAAASLQNIVYGVVLIAVLSLPVMAQSGPDISVWAIHPASVVMVGAYLFGLNLTRNAKAAPMWRPKKTTETQTDQFAEGEEGPVGVNQYALFAVLAALTLAAGAVIANIGEALVARYGVSQTAAGVFLTAIATSTPELVTTIAAVRRGALTLAVGAILGGNAFDVLFIAAADGAYREGSIYHAVGPDQAFWLCLTIAMTAALLLGLLARDRQGPVNIGFEGVTVLALYAVGTAAVFA